MAFAFAIGRGGGCSRLELIVLASCGRVAAGLTSRILELFNAVASNASMLTTVTSILASGACLARVLA